MALCGSCHLDLPLFFHINELKEKLRSLYRYFPSWFYLCVLLYLHCSAVGLLSVTYHFRKHTSTYHVSTEIVDMYRSQKVQCGGFGERQTFFQLVCCQFEEGMFVTFSSFHLSFKKQHPSSPTSIWHLIFTNKEISCKALGLIKSPIWFINLSFSLFGIHYKNKSTTLVQTLTTTKRARYRLQRLICL